MLARVDSIKVRQVEYKKPIAIIYNPNSGTQTNIRPFITNRLLKARVDFEFLETQKAFDTFLIPNTIDLTKYSAVIAVGGDGSFTEVVNGMLARKDGIKVPLGYIPNGSGGLAAIESGVYNLDMALDTIIKGTVTKFNVIECIADVDRSEVPDGIEGFFKRRFCNLMLTFSNLDIQVAQAAVPFKSCCGFGAYAVAFCKYLSCTTKKWMLKA